MTTTERTKDDDYINYQIEERESKTFHFSPDGRWCQSYIFIWTPGYFIVAGDMGNLIIEHQSLESFLGGLSWIKKSINSPHYFMEKVKTHQQDKFDPKGTLENIISTFEGYIDDEDWYDENSDLISIFNGHKGLLNGEISKMSCENFIEHIKDYEIGEEDIEEISSCDYELVHYDYNWDFLKGRISAIQEFATKMLSEVQA